MHLLCAENLFAFIPNQTCALGEAVAPKSGLYIDNLAGISLAAMSQLGKHTYKTAQEALEAKTQLAVMQLYEGLQSELLRYGYVIPQQQPAKGYGDYANGTAPVSLQPRGLTIQRLKNCSDIQALYLQSFQYKGAASESITFEIRNFEGGVLGAVLHSYTVGVVAEGLSTVFVDKHFSVDIAIVATPSGAPYNTVSAQCCLKLYGTRAHGGRDSLVISGYDGGTDVGTTYGITVCSAAVCWLPAFICKVLPSLYRPLYYRVAHLLLQELAIFSAPTEFSAGFVSTPPLVSISKEYAKQADEAQKIAVLSMLHNLKTADPVCISCDNPSSIKIKSIV